MFPQKHTHSKAKNEEKIKKKLQNESSKTLHKLKFKERGADDVGSKHL
jgi:hypothetical protein